MSSCCDNIYNRPVRFAVISQSHEGYAKYPPLWEPLPAKLSGEKKSFEITTGKIPPDKNVFLIFGVENCSESVKISFNGDLCTDFEDVDLSFIPGIGSQTSNYVNNKTRCFKCDISYDLTDDMTQLITVESDAQSDILNWLEIVVV